MVDSYVIEQIKFAVHKPLDYDKYEDTNTRQNTNCYAHAIGSTVHSDRAAYKIGVLSNSRKEEEKINSVEELKKFFLEDMKVIELEVEELKISKKELIGNEDTFLDINQHLVVLFAQQRSKKDKVNEFHFFRYDPVMGWTQKRWDCKPFEFEPKISWLDYWPNVEVGIFRITR